MRKKIIEKIEIPKEITCNYENNILYCKKEKEEIKRKIKSPKIKIKLENNTILLECEKANKNEIKIIKSFKKHIENMFIGLNSKFIYELESCNIHFPMNIKSENNIITINNFLGEKVPRTVKFSENVSIKIEGSKILVSSSDKEAAGITAGNIEKATKIKGRDRRIFQDGIYITKKPTIKR